MPKPAGSGDAHTAAMRRLSWWRRMTPIESIDRELIKLVAARHVALGNLDFARVSVLAEETDDLLERRFALTSASTPPGLTA